MDDRHPPPWATGGAAAAAYLLGDHIKRYFLEINIPNLQLENEIMKDDALSYEVSRTATILQDIIAIIMGLAFTTAVVVFMTKDNVPLAVSNINIESVLIFVCVISTIVRFFHGNMSYLQEPTM